MKFYSMMGAFALVSATSTFAFTTWYGGIGDSRVDTGLDDGSELSGYWKDYYGGNSHFDWSYPAEAGSYENALDPIADYCQGLCGEYTLGKDSLTTKPFFGIGLSIAGGLTNDQGVETALSAADATSMGGVCIGYVSDDDATLELKTSTPIDEIGQNNPLVNLPKAPKGNVLEFSWSDFKSANTDSTALDGETAATKLTAIVFRIQGEDGTTGFLNIMSIGAKGGNCKLTDGGKSAIGANVAQSRLDIRIVGRTLTFGKAVSKAEIITLQGQPVMQSASAQTIDLSKIPAGVYMVRAGSLSRLIQVK